MGAPSFVFRPAGDFFMSFIKVAEHSRVQEGDQGPEARARVVTDFAVGRRKRQPEKGPTLKVLAVDLDSLKCVEASASNFSDWGCCLVGEGLSVLNRNIGVKLEGADEFTRGRVTGHKPGYLTVVFRPDTRPAHEKRTERRYAVTKMAEITDLGRTSSYKCVITDASRSGCRVEGQDLERLPNDVLVYVEKFERPVRGQVAWSTSTSAGLRLYWDGASSFF